MKRLHLQRSEAPELKAHGHGVIFWSNVYGCIDDNCTEEHKIVLDEDEWKQILFVCGLARPEWDQRD